MGYLNSNSSGYLNSNCPAVTFTVIYVRRSCKFILNPESNRTSVILRYEYTDFWSLKLDSVLEFDSYILSEDDSSLRFFRLLDVDNCTVIPFKTHIRILISAADVLHA